MTARYQHSQDKIMQVSLPSNGFMRASLAIVAQAPLVAGASLAKFRPRARNFMSTYLLPEDGVRLLGYLPSDALQLRK
jgi:hypothetical protein